MAKRKKNVWIAAVLNFSLFGLGYIYLGKRRVFGFGLLISEIILNFATATVPLPTDFLVTLGYSTIIMGLAFAYDAYKETK